MTFIHRITHNRPKQEGRKYRSPNYDTTRWRQARLEHLQQHPLCVMCEKENRLTTATVVDHIRPVGTFHKDKRDEAFWDSSNWQSLCEHHHNKKSGRERHER